MCVYVSVYVRACLYEAFLRVFRWQSLRETLRDFLEEIVTVIHMKTSLNDSLDKSFIELSSASAIVTGQGGQPITDIKHIECFFSWLGGRCSRKALDHPLLPYFLWNSCKTASLSLSRSLSLLKTNFWKPNSNETLGKQICGTKKATKPNENQCFY